LGGRGRLLRDAPLELLEELSESMSVLEWLCAKFYVRTLILPVGNG
jgi:hypothetical protein